mmetsp:Transcript_7312/g.9300  ORF Transcript_7312/g.9300 Transcript_7312/m.9300 type:complete len:99 (-) Transcript_7312:3502-3798(-)
MDQRDNLRSELMAAKKRIAELENELKIVQIENTEYQERLNILEERNKSSFHQVKNILEDARKDREWLDTAMAYRREKTVQIQEETERTLAKRRSSMYF